MSSAPGRSADRSKPVLLWWRDDLRLADNPALRAAAHLDRPVVSIYVDDRESPGIRPLGEASSWWRHHALLSLSNDLRAIGGSPVIYLQGAARTIVASAAAAVGADMVFWNRRYIAADRAVDDALEAEFGARAVEVRTFNGLLVHEPEDLLPKGGGFFHLYGPYWKALTARQERVRNPLPAPLALRPAPFRDTLQGEVSLDRMGLLPKRDWAAGLEAAWRPGEEPGQFALQSFVATGLSSYETCRNDLSIDGSSRLSPYLRHGEVSPVAVVHAADRARGKAGQRREQTKFLQEVTWRDFTYNLLVHAPEMTTKPYAARFKAFPWRRLPAEELRAWQRGRTGYPIVDAGMRQLWQTGWMHNRVRMITASFLVKHLLGDWKIGEAWFWDTLCDADPANNVVNWQWVAGCGPDAAPFFRIFNPVLQGQKFDPDGAYVARFVPELARLGKTWIHKPWEAPADVLRTAGVELGRSYPRPIVEHAAARERALEVFRSTRPIGADAETG